MLQTRFAAIAFAMLAWSASTLAHASDSDSPAEQVRDALDAEDALLVLRRLRDSPGSEAGLACVAALMHEHVLSELWRPPPPRADATPEVAADQQARREAGLTDLREEVTELREAYARCATEGLRPRPNTSERRAFEERSVALDDYLGRTHVDDAALAALDTPDGLDTSFRTAREVYDAVTGVPPAPPERAPLPGWRSMPVITSGLLTIVPLLTVVVSARVRGSIGGRLGLASLGLGVSSLVGLTVGRTWLRSGKTLVLVGGLLTAGVLGTGAITLALDGPSRRHAFGASMLAGGAVDLAWWIGGVILTRQDRAAHEQWQQRLRPTVDVDSTHASLGLTGSF